MELVDSFRKLKEKYGFKFELKEEQKEIIRCIMNNENCIGILPTGFGKSMCFIVPALIHHETKRGICLVVSPLKSLIRDQSESLTELGIDSMVLQKRQSDEEIAALKEGKIPFLFTSPELLTSGYYRLLLHELPVTILVCDEAHCISEGGEDFRPDFRNMDSIRSFLTNIPVLALTATATEGIISDTLKYLLLPVDTKIVAFVLDSSTFTTAFTIFSYLMEEVGMDAYDGDVNVHNRIIELYTSSTDDETQSRIIDQFKKCDGKLRVLVATVAFGMGIQISNISMIINWRAPKTLMSYWQEVGRCARDNRRGLAVNVMYPYPRSLTGCDKNVVTFVKNNGCYRFSVLNLFKLSCMDTESLISIEHKTDCQGHCAIVCSCSFCLCCSFCMSKCLCPLKSDESLDMFLT